MWTTRARARTAAKRGGAHAPTGRAWAFTGRTGESAAGGPPVCITRRPWPPRRPRRQRFRAIRPDRASRRPRVPLGFEREHRSAAWRACARSSRSRDAAPRYKRRQCPEFCSRAETLQGSRARMLSMDVQRRSMRERQRHERDGPEGVRPDRGVAARVRHDPSAQRPGVPPSGAVSDPEAGLRVRLLRCAPQPSTAYEGIRDIDSGSNRGDMSHPPLQLPPSPSGKLCVPMHLRQD